MSWVRTRLDIPDNAESGGLEQNMSLSMKQTSFTNNGKITKIFTKDHKYTASVWIIGL